MTGTRTYDAEQQAIPSDMDGMSTVALMQENVFFSLSSQAFPGQNRSSPENASLRVGRPFSIRLSAATDHQSLPGSQQPSGQALEVYLLAGAAKRLCDKAEEVTEAFGK